MNEYHRLTLAQKELLPNKARKYRFPQFIWIIPPFHDNFPHNRERDKFSEALFLVADKFSEMHAFNLKKVWNSEDTMLYIKETKRFTAKGYKTYWLAVDATMKFVDTKITKDQLKTMQKKLQDSFRAPNKYYYNKQQTKVGASNFNKALSKGKGTFLPQALKDGTKLPTPPPKHY